MYRSAAHTVREAVRVALLSLLLLQLPTRGSAAIAQVAPTGAEKAPSMAVLDVESASRLETEISGTIPLIFVPTMTIQVLLRIINTSNVGGGPYNISGVFIENHLTPDLFLNGCMPVTFTCTTTDDPVTGQKVVRIDVGTVQANETLEIVMSLGVLSPGSMTIASVLTQNEFDPTPNDNIASISFLLEEGGTIRGYKFEDLNGDGVWDPGEPGFNEWPIYLEDGVQRTTTMTQDIDLDGDGIIAPDEVGHFEFNGVPPGHYQVHEDMPEGWRQSAPEFTYYEGDIVSGQVVEDLAFGNYIPAFIIGRVFDDADRNGVFDHQEPGFEGRTVTLSGTNGLGETVSRTTTTGSLGLFTFEDVDPGVYTVASDKPDASYEPTLVPEPFTVISRGIVETLDFGFAAPAAPVLVLSVDPEVIETEIGIFTTYLVTLTNAGTADATGVQIHQRYEELELMYVPVFEDPCTLQPTTERGQRQIDCLVGTLAPMESASFDMGFRGVNVNSNPIADPGPTVKLVAVADNHPDVLEEVTHEIGAFTFGMQLYRAGPQESNKRTAGEVDVYLDSVLVYEGLASGTATGLLERPLTALEPVLHVVPAGDTVLANAMLTKQLSLAIGDSTDLRLPSSLMLVLTGDATSIDDAIPLKEIPASSADPTQVSFAVVHAAESSGELEIAMSGSGPNTLEYGESTQFEGVSPDTQLVDVRQPGAAEPLATFQFDWTGAAGEALVLVLSDGPEGLELSSMRSDGTITVPSSPSTPSTPSTAAGQEELPEHVQLLANYPNPFNPVTTIPFALPAPGTVQLEVFDALGRRVALLADGPMRAGRHVLPFHADNLPSGVYAYRLTAGTEVRARTMVVLK